ncbi:MAG: pyruvate/2-oxoglutarate/acetoin dehydrogenase E1 component/TPP-dependent pyruvate [Saprospiraceae bacterium]|jgi:pyruvate/2-oxoglutarate/acetoin dehydrogenase E1 component/TPP-dependent pyruvate/acetoin dehydrogenase alpha subunit
MNSEVKDITANSDEGPKSSKFREEVLQDFYTVVMSREVSLIGRKEVLTGKAKFGILGDGKELPQIAMARVFKKGDWRSGYYRDQTFMFGIGECSIEQFFAQLYADTENDPFSGGRQMNSHYATPTIDSDDNWLPLKDLYNVSSDISCTGGQMARGLGLAHASSLFRKGPDFPHKDTLTNEGKEVIFCTIGDASTSEGPFWESMNAATVNRVPLIACVWDDGYGISVPVAKQTTKGSISRAMEGFLVDESGDGMLIYTVKGWNYPALCAVFEKVTEKVRKESRPALIHVQELTQPQGHSTSGSHERYKSKERLQWEKEYDCNVKFEEWILKNELATQEELDIIKEKAANDAKEGRTNAWNTYAAPVKETVKNLLAIYTSIVDKSESVVALEKDLNTLLNPVYSDVVKNARILKQHMLVETGKTPEDLQSFLDDSFESANEKYHTHLYSSSDTAAVNIPAVPAEYSESSKNLNGYQIINSFFDIALDKYPNMIGFGEDVGKIGDVNQGFAGLQEKYGEHRVFDTGIREWSIMGMAIGTAMRGLRPVAEIQYLDYLLYGLSPLSDDLATLRYRSNGIQKAPAIIRTRGHRLEGVWHAGSPLGMMINSLRGMYILTPRNMVQAVGFYNTLLQADDPAIVIECLNGYRLKETLPDNLGEYTLPLGVPEVLQEGTDITIVTYGSCVREAEKGIKMLEKTGVSIELIDVQSLLPFDLEHSIVESLKKTNKIIFLDEDMPGGATAFMMKEVLETQGGYQYLDAPPVTISAWEHRPPFGSDGDYFTKPGPEDIFDEVMEIMRAYEPDRFW